MASSISPSSLDRRRSLAVLVLGLFVLQLVPAAQAQAVASSGTPASTAQGDNPVVKLNPFVVERSQDRGYSTANQLGATRVNIPLEDVPTSVVVLNEEFLKDVGALTPNDAFRYVSGMNTTNLAYNGLVTLRGFVSQGLAYTDGLPSNMVLDGASLGDFANIERVEVIKGPNGVLYGSHVAGGVIDMITKKPQFQPSTELTLVAGSWDLYRAQLDTTGPLGSSGKLAYRFVGMYQDGETVNHGPNDKRMFVPSMTWRPSAKTQVTLSFQYYNPNIATSRSQWFSDAAGAISTFLSPRSFFDDQDEHRNNWDYVSTVTVEQTISDAWKLRLVGRNIDASENKLNYTHGTFSFISKTGAPLLTPSGASATATNYTFAQAFANPLFGDITVARQRQLNLIGVRRPAAYLDLVGIFDTGPLHHTLLTSVQVVGENTDTKTILWAYPSTSVLHPVYVDDSLALAGAQTINTNSNAWSTDYSAGIQDNVSLWNDRINAVAGVRRDRVPSHTLNRLKNAEVDVTDEQNSYRGGLIGKIAWGASAFANWSQTFTPVVGFDAFNNPLKNQVATVREAGLKEEALDGRLTVTASAFDIKQTNASTVVVVNSATGLTGNLQTGFIESRGWETDIAWQASNEITFMIGAGSLTSKTDKGIASRGVGEGFNGKIFGKYTFPAGWARGFAVGAGYDYNPRSAGDGAGGFFLPSYALVDAFVSYQHKNWRAQLNVQNVADKLYAAGAVSGAYVTSGLPREFRFTVSYHY